MAASSSSDDLQLTGDFCPSICCIVHASFFQIYKMDVSYVAHPGAAGLDSVTLNSILLYVQTLRQDTSLIRNQNAEIMDRIRTLETQVARMQPTPGDGLAPELSEKAAIEWSCPICGVILQDERSFKGHIRRLVDPSGRPKCHINIRDQRHVSLVSRFDGDDDYARGKQFCRAFYGFVRCAISAKFDPSESFVMIQSWLAAAASPHDPFPECSSGSSGGCSSGY